MSSGTQNVTILGESLATEVSMFQWGLQHGLYANMTGTFYNNKEKHPDICAKRTMCKQEGETTSRTRREVLTPGHTLLPESSKGTNRQYLHTSDCAPTDTSCVCQLCDSLVTTLCAAMATSNYLVGDAWFLFSRAASPFWQERELWSVTNVPWDLMG